MSESSFHGIPQGDPSEAFAGDEARKSRLILEARLSREQQESEVAAAKLAEAAAIEEKLGEVCAQQGLREKSFVHRFSAASCWAQAGNFFEAITLCDRLLNEQDCPTGSVRGSKLMPTPSALAAPNGTENSCINRTLDKGTQPSRTPGSDSGFGIQTETLFNRRPIRRHISVRIG
jgi:hypothetical protein